MITTQAPAARNGWFAARGSSTRFTVTETVPSGSVVTAYAGVPLPWASTTAAAAATAASAHRRTPTVAA
jgi:hypothetical protein